AYELTPCLVGSEISIRDRRIDLLLASNPLAERCEETGIDYEIRSMEKPSDHAPVWAKFRV
ncbi:hypothetical protein V6E22_20185, partial [Citrobacter freundii]